MAFDCQKIKGLPAYLLSCKTAATLSIISKWAQFHIALKIWQVISVRSFPGNWLQKLLKT